MLIDWFCPSWSGGWFLTLWPTKGFVHCVSTLITQTINWEQQWIYNYLRFIRDEDVTFQVRSCDTMSPWLLLKKLPVHRLTGNTVKLIVTEKQTQWCHMVPLSEDGSALWGLGAMARPKKSTSGCRTQRRIEFIRKCLSSKTRSMMMNNHPADTCFPLASFPSLLHLEMRPSGFALSSFLPSRGLSVLQRVSEGFCRAAALAPLTENTEHTTLLKHLDAIWMQSPVKWT